MTQAPIKLVRLFAIAWCAAHPLAVAGCARHSPPSDAATPDPGQRVPITLRVTNSNWSDVRIYLVRGAMWTRLGLVTTNSTVDFTVPTDLLSGATSVSLVANPVAGTGSWTTSLPVVAPGDEFELVIENFLQYSHLVVR
jgi:hypothetical protein